MRLALVQANPTVGDFAGNVELVVDGVRRSRAAGADLVIFGEMMLSGYPVEDLVFRETFVSASRASLNTLRERLTAEGLDDVPVAVGYLDADGPVRAHTTGQAKHSGARDAAALLHRGDVVATYYKHHLPNYGVFDEKRHFVSGQDLPVISLNLGGEAVSTAMIVCEDIWERQGPVDACAAAGVRLILCLNGSPYEQHKDQTRLQVCQRAAARSGAVVAYVNLVGGQDELIFDGESLVVHPDGRVLARAAAFSDEVLVLDVDLTGGGSEDVTAEVMDATDGPPMSVTEVSLRVDPGAKPAQALPVPIAAELAEAEEIWRALTLGVADYVRKNGFRSVIMGLSGGIDSSVCAAIAVDALGADRVYGVALPSAYSSHHSLEDAAELAELTGLNYRVVPIAGLVKAFAEELPLTGLAAENLQARIRGVILMGISNSEGQLVLTTGNKSEYAVGYSTLYGDAVGGFAPIKDVYKTMVWRLARWRNEHAASLGQRPPIPERSITKPPSAELGPDQLDTDSLPPYEQLDAILRLSVDLDWGREGIVAAGHDPAVVDRVLYLVDNAEYKRRQTAPGPKISLKAFGRDRRLPIAKRWNEGLNKSA